MVEDLDPDPRPIGLLFAGSSLIAVANPVGDVLNYLNAFDTLVSGATKPLSFVGGTQREDLVAAGVRGCRIVPIPIERHQLVQPPFVLDDVPVHFDGLDIAG